MKILIINAGSSSLKYKLFLETQEIASGLIEEIGAPGKMATQAEALQHVCNTLDLSGVKAVGHRVVHGGTLFVSPTLINDDNFRDLKQLSSLAPLHNPANIAGIETARRLLPHAKHIAIFDTAFHHQLPEAAYRYAIDRNMAETLHIRRYGFHGISHQYVTERACELLKSPIESTELITLHLGNGASVSAVQNGRSIDTSMGMTPLEGLVMGTRSGDMDPAVTLILAKHLGSIEAADTYLNKQSGLKGLCGDSDCRKIEARHQTGDAAASLALEMMVHRLIKYIGAYMALLPKLKAIIFTGGIGENSQWIRHAVLSKLAHCGLHLDETRNTKPYNDHLQLTCEQSRVQAFAIRTNEELLMAKQVLDICEFHSAARTCLSMQ